MKRIGSIGRALALAVGLVLMCSVGASAADGSDAAVGYSYLRDADTSASVPNGFFVSFGQNVTSLFGVVADFSANFKTVSAGLGSVSGDASVKYYSYQIGPRVMSHPGPVRGFGQVLVGAETISGSASASGFGASLELGNSTTGFAFTPGAGIDVMAGQVGVRAGVNYRVARLSGLWRKQVQVAVGVVFHL